MSTPTLRWLQIHQYEQFEPVRIEFSAKENLILGLNGAGKTQLLRLIRAVLCLDFGELLRKSFEVEFDLVTRGSGDNPPEVVILGRISNKVELPPFRTSEELLSDAAGPADTLSATIKFSSAGDYFTIDLRGDTIHYEGGDGSFSEDFPYRDQGELKPRRLVAAQGTKPKKRMLGLQFPVCEACFVGESDRQFEELTTSLEFTMGRYFDPSSLTSTTANGTGRMWRQDVLRLVLWAWSSRRGGWPQPEELGINGALLDAWRKPLQAEWIRFRPNVVRETERDGETEYGCRGIEFVVRFQGGPQVAHSELTFGQRRYIYAGLVSLPRPGVPVVCDEIDNGMHPRLILALLEMWSDRQVFVASHNQLVIDSTNFYSPADVREKIHIVRRRDDGRQVVKVFDDETAREIHAAIDIKIQRPSDVLEAEGLW